MKYIRDEDVIEQAYKLYMDRKSSRLLPLGEVVWSGSKARFVVDSQEKRKCCESISEPMLFSHTSSVKHIAALFGVSVNSLNMRIKRGRSDLGGGT